MNDKITKFLCIPRSLILNLRLFPLSKAIKIPVLIGPGIKMIGVKRGAISIAEEYISFAAVKIGISKGPFDYGKHGGFIKIDKNSSITFKGRCYICKEAKLSATNGGKIVFGNRVYIGPKVLVSSNSEVVIGDYTSIGWNAALMDWDGHNLYNMETMEISNKPRPIKLERCCWIGANSNVMKGVTLSHHTIVPTRTVLTKSNDTPYAVFGGSPNRVLNEGIVREEFLDK